MRNRISLLTVDRLVILAFVILLMTGEAQRLLDGSGLRWAYLLLLSLGVGYLASPLAYWAAHRGNVLDVPGGRKAHAAPTALLGGAAVYAAFVGTVLRNFSFSYQLKGVILGASLVFLVGLVDDIRELPARSKLFVQLAAVGILIRYGVTVTFLPPGIWGDLGEWMITAVWIIGITNAVNFLDGMDGLAAGMCAIMTAFYGLGALQNHHDFMVYLSMPLLGACLGFLPYNFRPHHRALLFLGDSGSTFLGFMMAALGIMGNWAGDNAARLAVPVLILGVPIFDMSFTTVMRVHGGQVRSLRQWIEYTGRDHLHHRLAALRVGNTGAVLIIYTITLWLGLSALTLKNATGLTVFLQLLQSAVVFGLLTFFMLFVKRQYVSLEAERSPELRVPEIREEGRDHQGGEDEPSLPHRI